MSKVSLRVCTAFVLAVSLTLGGCAKTLTVEGKGYPPYGVFNAHTHKSKDVCYEVSAGNVVWSAILFATIAAPIYFIGWELFNPVRVKKGPEDKCTIDD
jgi:hypothetical protein